MTGNRHSRRHQHGMRMLLGLVVETAVDRMPSWIGWNASGKEYKVNGIAIQGNLGS